MYEQAVQAAEVISVVEGGVFDGDRASEHASSTEVVAERILQEGEEARKNVFEKSEKAPFEESEKAKSPEDNCKGGWYV